jgi:hypothetical protein
MAEKRNEFVLSRRGVLMLAAGAGMTAWNRAYAFSSDFWNQKDPSQWSHEEIDRLTTKSPWAKEVSAEYSPGEGGGMGGTRSGGAGGGGGGWPEGGGGGGGLGGPRIGGLGIPGMGGGRGGGRGRGGGQRPQSLKGIVRWESAQPILDALKAPLPDAFANHYVISVNGFPLNPGHRRNAQGQGNDTGSSSQTDDDALDRIKGLTFLEPKGRPGAQPGIAQQQATSGSGSVLFGFAKDILALKPGDDEVTFFTQFGSLKLKTKFNLKEMTYHRELAL